MLILLPIDAGGSPPEIKSGSILSVIGRLIIGLPKPQKTDIFPQKQKIVNFFTNRTCGILGLSV